MEGTNVEGFEKTSSFLPPKHTPSFCASHVNKLTCLVLPLVLRPNPNFRDSSLYRIFNFGIRISGKSESIFQFWDFCESFNKNLAFFNKTWHFRLPNVKIFSHFSTKPRKIFAKSCESLANPGSESWKKDSNQSQIMKRDSNPGSRIRFGLNTTEK